jgi:hypothetical protein
MPDEYFTGNFVCRLLFEQCICAPSSWQITVIDTDISRQTSVLPCENVNLAFDKKLTQVVYSHFNSYLITANLE